MISVRSIRVMAISVKNNIAIGYLLIIFMVLVLIVVFLVAARRSKTCRFQGLDMSERLKNLLTIESKIFYNSVTQAHFTYSFHSKHSRYFS